MEQENRTLTAIPGILAGHATDAGNGTGCTAILCPTGFTPGVCVPGMAPGSRETDLMRPESLVDSVHGILLTGGSAFGLGAAEGVMRFLREKGHGYATAHGIVPIVGAAVLYDLDGNRQAGVLPDASMGYTAAASACSAPVQEGSVGAGTGARCGRIFADPEGEDHSAKAGIGSFLSSRGDVQVAALVAVNALGNVYHPETGAFLAGGRDGRGKPLEGEALLDAMARRDAQYLESAKAAAVRECADINSENLEKTLQTGNTLPCNTVLAVIVTNIPLDKAGTTRLARMAAAGLPRSIRPAHMLQDGDIVFALSAKGNSLERPGAWKESLLGALGAEALAMAAARAVLHT